MDTAAVGQEHVPPPWEPPLAGDEVERLLGARDPWTSSAANESEDWDFRSAPTTAGVALRAL